MMMLALVIVLVVAGSLLLAVFQFGLIVIALSEGEHPWHNT